MIWYINIEKDILLFSIYGIITSVHKPILLWTVPLARICNLFKMSKKIDQRRVCKISSTLIVALPAESRLQPVERLQTTSWLLFTSQQNFHLPAVPLLVSDANQNLQAGWCTGRCSWRQVLRRSIEKCGSSGGSKFRHSHWPGSSLIEQLVATAQAVMFSTNNWPTSLPERTSNGHITGTNHPIYLLSGSRVGYLL